MKKDGTKVKFNNGWCYALINNRLAEIVFNEKWGLYGYCYIKRDEYSKSEQKTINKDIKSHQFSYRNGTFRDKIKDIIFPLGEVEFSKDELKKLSNKISKI